ncbi:MAG: histidine kinase [Ignavibacteriae bacterium]|nr:histidine kinase [Ignavibacteriota bacterium]
MKTKFTCFIILFVLVLTSCLAQPVRITINVIAPSSTPKDATIFIAGNEPKLGDWDPGKVSMKQLYDSLWTTELTFPKGLFLEFKITRGSWNNQAMYKQGEVPPNTQATLNNDTTITLHPTMWSDEGEKTGGGVLGTVTYHKKLQGDGLKYERDVIVWLPPSYESDTSKRYPVLYMHDGQNIVDPNTSFIGYDWHVDEVAESLIKFNKMKEIIVVGIYNSPDRREEYAQTELGEAYQKFIVTKLKPMIDAEYRTLSDRENTGVMGSSMGGLASFLLVWNYPEVFSMAGCLSPAFPEESISGVEQYNGNEKNIRLYIDNGGVGLEKELQIGCDLMLPVLRKKGFKDGKNLEWFLDEKAEHNERAWAARLWRPLMFMFGR